MGDGMDAAAKSSTPCRKREIPSDIDVRSKHLKSEPLSEANRELAEKRARYNQQARKKENDAYEMAKDCLKQYDNIQNVRKCDVLSVTVNLLERIKSEND